LTHRLFDFATLDPRACYKLLIGTVVPRPIAWVTTLSPEGVVNAAPYSFFNCVSSDPPIVCLGVENKAATSFKDTAWNIRTTEEFTVNIVDDANLDAMNVTATAFLPEVDELAMAGLTAAPGRMVACPRIAEAPVALECRRHTTLSVGKSREIVLGLVLAAHIREDIVDAERFYVDPARLDAVGRMGGHGYARTRDYFDLPTLSVEEVEARRGDRRRA
jgi:flavin reductase (DIM6/NTAB) family NADH-FMN oxidoreductase RutF